MSLLVHRGDGMAILRLKLAAILVQDEIKTSEYLATVFNLVKRGGCHSSDAVELDLDVLQLNISDVSIIGQVIKG